MRKSLRQSTIALIGVLATIVALGAGCPWLDRSQAPNSTVVTTTQPSPDRTAGVGGEAPLPEGGEEAASNDNASAVETPTAVETNADEETTVVNSNGLVEPGAPVTTNTAPTTEGSTTTTAGVYLDYAPSQLEQPTGRTLVFFHASWCPTCRALEQDIQANLSAIPSDVTILKADFDTELDLRKEYGVNVQSTVVQVDTDANAVTTISGVTRLDALLDRLQ